MGTDSLTHTHTYTHTCRCFTAFHVTCAQMAGYHMIMLSGVDEDDEVGVCVC